MIKLMNTNVGLLASLALFAASNALAYGGNVAIAINPRTGSWGAASGAYTRVDAETQALANCGADCVNVDAYELEGGQSGLKETFSYNGWVAYAYSNTGHWGASGQHDSQYDAEESAYNNCGGAANGCYIVRSLASFDYQDDQTGTDINNPSQNDQE